MTRPWRWRRAWFGLALRLHHAEPHEVVLLFVAGAGIAWFAGLAVGAWWWGAG